MSHFLTTKNKFSILLVFLQNLLNIYNKSNQNTNKHTLALLYKTLHKAILSVSLDFKKKGI